MTNKDKLRELLLEVFLLEPEEFSFELSREQIETWDSLGTVSMAVGVQETFGYHMKPAEALAITSIPEIIALLEANGISFAD